MNSETADRIIDLNLQFYQSFAGAFSKTRRRLQVGVQKLLTSLNPENDILDLGCGNGELWKSLAKSGHRGLYVGIDFSLPLLKTSDISAQEVEILEKPISSDRVELALHRDQTCFMEANLTEPGWEEPLGGMKFEAILAFAFLHHIPGDTIRASLVKTIHQLMSPNGVVMLSVWQFLNSPRLVKRLQPWESIGINRESLDSGDYLLDWKSGGYGLRYVHYFSTQELSQLARANGFQVYESFNSDGEGGKLSLYQIWGKQG